MYTLGLTSLNAVRRNFSLLSPGGQTSANQQPKSCVFSPITASTSPTLLRPARQRVRTSAQSTCLNQTMVSDTGGKERSSVEVVMRYSQRTTRFKAPVRVQWLLFNRSFRQQTVLRLEFGNSCFQLFSRLFICVKFLS